MSSSKATSPANLSTEFLDRKGKMSQLAGLFSILSLKREADNQARSREAESQAVSRVMWGGKPVASGEDDMATTVVFRDQIIQAPAARPGLGTLAKLGIGAALLASGVGAGAAIPYILGALIPKPVPPIVQPGTHSTTERDYTIGDIEVIEHP